MEQLKLSVPKKIGKRVYNFAVEGQNLFDVVMNSKKLSFGDVSSCGCCQSDDLELSAHIAQEKFKYVVVRCNKCKATLNFGQQTKTPDVFYLTTKEDKKTLDWIPFVPGDKK